MYFNHVGSTRFEPALKAGRLKEEMRLESGEADPT